MQQSKNFPIKRASTEAELAFLAQVLVTLPTPKRRILKALLNTAVFWIFSLVIFCIIWFISGLVVSAIFNFDIGISSVYANIIFPFAAVLAALYSINSTRRWLQETNGLYKQIKADISIKQTITECYKVNAVLCFQEPEHHGLIYLVLLNDQVTTKYKIRVIYDYASQDAQAIEQDLITITTQLTINTAPQSQTFINYEYNGQPFVNVEHHDLTAAPEQWPEADSWLNEDWMTLATRYSGNVVEKITNK